MMRFILGIAAAATVLTAVPVSAQATRPSHRPGGAITDTNPQPAECREWDVAAAAWKSCSAGRRESFQLAAGNAAAAAVTVYGGDYILSQTCTGYGSLALQVRGPDGASWLTLVTKTASDLGNGTGIALGSYAAVRVAVTGTSGCNAILARVPA